MLSSNPGPRARWISMAPPMIFSVSSSSLFISVPPCLCGETNPSIVHSLHKPTPRRQIAVQPIHAAVAELRVVIVARVAALAPPLALHSPGTGGVHDAAGNAVAAHELRPVACAEHVHRPRRAQRAQG